MYTNIMHKALTTEKKIKKQSNFLFHGVKGKFNPPLGPTTGEISVLFPLKLSAIQKSTVVIDSNVKPLILWVNKVSDVPEVLNGHD
jgi:hypothetical protein